MIRFQCPVCNSVITAPDQRAGDKVDCPKCGQRLQIPAPAASPPKRNKTILGSLLPFRKQAKPAAPTPRQAPPASATLQPQSSPPATRQPVPASPKPVSRRKFWLLVGLLGGGLLVAGFVAAAVVVVGAVVWVTVEPEPATCRELAERLQRKGMSVRWMRKQHKHPAVIILPRDDERDEQVIALDPAAGGWAVVIQYPTAAEAREEAGSLRSGFAHGRFVIYGDPDLVSEIKSRLTGRRGSEGVSWAQKMEAAKERQNHANDLRQISLALLNYHDVNQTFPADQQAFLAWAQQNAPEVVPLVQGGQYTVLYARVRVAEVTEGTTNTVAAYENQPSPGGRLVATLDGSVQSMTEAEFAAKPRLKAKK